MTDSHTNREANNTTATKQRTLIKEPQQYQVIFHNDDSTTMEFVTQIIIEIFGRSADEAVALMMRVHKNGQATIGIYSYDVAMTKTTIATQRARAEGFPLRITCEPV